MSDDIARPQAAHSFAAALVLLAMILAASGCGEPPSDAPEIELVQLEYRPGQDQALSIVLGVYGTPAGAKPPVVRWRTTGLDCAGTAWRWTDGRCIRGLFDVSRPGEIQVAFWSGAEIPVTSLAHEARHWLLWRTTGDGHPSHDGDFYDRVAAANQVLWDAYDRGGLR